MSRQLILYIAMSLDGYIAKEDGNIDFLSVVETPGEDFGYADFQQDIDTVIWGRKTFDKVLSFGIGVPHKDKKVYVISRERTGNLEHAVYHNNVAHLVQELKKEKGKNIYCDGGAEIVFELLQQQLFDRLIISVIPHLLGSGVRLFKEGFAEQGLQLKRSIAYPSGLVQLWYNLAKK